MVSSYAVRRVPPSYRPLGLLISLLLHFGVLVVWLVVYNLLPPRVLETEVYSVTLEGGKTIGGKFQLAQNDKKTPVAPIKNVAAESKVAESKVEKTEPKPPPVEEKKPVEPPKEVKPPEDAIKTGPEEKETPVPTAAPATPEAKKPEPKPTPVPTKAPEKPPEKAKPTPEAKPTAKADDKNRSDAKSKTKGQKQAEDPDKDYQKALQRYLGESTDAGGSGFGAARLGGSGMGGGIQRPPEFFTYITTLKNRVKANWRWFDSTSSLVATAEMELGPDGRIFNERIIQSSGSAEFDQSLIRAIRAADPLPPPPESVYKYLRTIQLVFDPRQY